MHQLEIMPEPPTIGAGQPVADLAADPAPRAAHEEGGERLFSVTTSSFVDSGRGSVAALAVDSVRYVDGRFEAVSGTREEVVADLVLLALGFVGTRARWCRRASSD